MSDNRPTSRNLRSGNAGTTDIARTDPSAAPIAGVGNLGLSIGYGGSRATRCYSINKDADCVRQEPVDIAPPGLPTGGKP